MAEILVGVQEQMSVAAAPEQKAEKEMFRMPLPQSGIVKWGHTDVGRCDCYAIVTATYRDMINVLVITGDGYMPRPREGVRHKNDPFLKTMTVPNPGGIWELTEFERSVNENVLSKLAAVRNQVK